MNLPATPIPDDARSEEHLYDKRFIKRWTDRCIEVKHKYGQEVANDFARKMFSPFLIREINKDIAERKSRNGKG